MAAERGVIAQHNWPVGTVTPDDGSHNPTMPPENVLLMQPKERYQTGSGVTQIDLRFASSDGNNHVFKTVAVLFANVQNASATFRIRTWLDSQNPAVDSPNTDSGSMTFWASPNLDAFDRTHALYQNDVGISAETISVEITDSSNPENFLSIGNIILSDSWKPSLNISYGSTAFGFNPTASQTVGTNGVAFPGNFLPSRRRQLLFESNDEVEVYTQWYPFLADVGNKKPFLFAGDPDDASHAFYRMAYGVFDGPLAPVESSFRFFRLRANLQELY
jgi:hypothetical protein